MFCSTIASQLLTSSKTIPIKEYNNSFKSSSISLISIKVFNLTLIASSKFLPINPLYIASNNIL